MSTPHRAGSTTHATAYPTEFIDEMISTFPRFVG
jgi:hypothetical protein